MYPTVPMAPLDPQSCSLNVIENNQPGFVKKRKILKKIQKYTKILDRLIWLNAWASRLSVASGISSVAMLSTFIGLPMLIPLGVVSLAGVSVSGVTTVLTMKYQKKLTKVTKLVDIVTSVIAVFETSVSKALNDGKIDEREFNMLQTLHLKALNKLSKVDSQNGSRKQKPIGKSLLEEINDTKKLIGTKAS